MGSREKFLKWPTGIHCARLEAQHVTGFTVSWETPKLDDLEWGCHVGGTETSRSALGIQFPLAFWCNKLPDSALLGKEATGSTGFHYVFLRLKKENSNLGFG